jgi:Domain of unknown function (DUF4432)
LGYALDINPLFSWRAKVIAYQRHSQHRNYGCRLREFILKDYRAVSLENEKVRVTILIDKGADIYELLYKPRDVDFLWKSSIGLRSMKNYQPMIPGKGGTFLDFYEGGWQEMFPWGGHASTYRGVDTGLHGEVALASWDYQVDIDTPEEIKVTCTIRTRRAPFLLKKTFTLYRHRADLRINEVVVNESDEQLDVVWGHHPAFGWPFLDDSCVIDLPPCRVRTAESLDAGGRLAENTEGDWPMFRLRHGGETDLSKIPGPSCPSHDIAFLHGFVEGWYALRSQSQSVGIGLAWDVNIFPWIWYYQLFRGAPDYPFWGMEYVASIEIATSMAVKFSDAISNGTAKVLAGGESLTSEMWAFMFEGTTPVTRISSNGVEF